MRLIWRLLGSGFCMPLTPLIISDILAVYLIDIPKSIIHLKHMPLTQILFGASGAIQTLVEPPVNDA
jgi:hypothetical protein